ncbi:MAG: serine/threonine protein kinase [Acidobacteria bacterium]|nr:serine/threonine protein kinase [Acidobacteriota bacterium]
MIGQTVSHYRVIDYLGSGSLGEVYLAQDERLQRRVALKILRSRLTTDQACLLRLQQEAQTASALSHPNILTIFDIGESDSIHFMASEFVEGQTLRHIQKDAPWDLSEAIDVVLQIAAGLAAAHQAGIVHCDIKPDNLMRGRDGVVKILDFGIARLFEKPNDMLLAATANLALTENEITGTALYMSPEQVRGESLDARTDIFSLGVVLYEMLCGRRPFEGDNVAQVFQAILHEEPLTLSHFREDVPLALEAIIRTTLEKNRQARYPSIKPLIAELQHLKSQLRLACASPTADAIDHHVGNYQAATNLASANFVEAGGSETVTWKGSRRQNFVWQQRKRLVATGMAAWLLMAFDLLFIQPQGGERIRDAARLLLGAMCLTLVVTARRKPRSGFQALPQVLSCQRY